MQANKGERSTTEESWDLRDGLATSSRAQKLYFNDSLPSFQTRRLFRLKKGVCHEMQQSGVCHGLPPLRSASVFEYWNTQCARLASRTFRSRSDGETAMHKCLSCTLSRLSSSEPGAIVRVSGCLPGLRPIHLYWFRTRMTRRAFCRR